MSSEEILLTVLIVTYNQKDYISRALDSVLNQKTGFAFEVVVHDDASYDGTEDIIEYYRSKYPSIIKLVIEKENQYSKGADHLMRALAQCCRRKYMIILEGDDFWCDSGKLQKQLEYMERHPEASATTHRCEILRKNEEGNLIRVGYAPSKKKQNSWSIKELIDWEDAPHTTSMLYRTQYFKEMPDSILSISAGDWRTAVWLRTRGEIHYSNDIMSAHEQFVKGSYTYDNFSKGIYADYDSLLKKRQQWCESLDNATNHRYAKLFQLSQDRRLGEYLWYKGKYKEAVRFKGFTDRQKLKKRVIMWAIGHLPGVERLYKTIVK